MATGNIYHIKRFVYRKALKSHTKSILKATFFTTIMKLK